MNGWIKEFADGTREIGTDEYVRRKVASWTRGRLTDMVGVMVRHGKHMICIEGTGEFWQSDDYECLIYEPTPSLKVRRIQKKLEEMDRFLISDCVGNGHIYRVTQTSPTGFGTRTHIQDWEIGKWLTVELYVDTGQVLFRLTENKI